MPKKISAPAKPESPTVSRLRKRIEREAKERNVSVSQILRELDAPMPTVTFRLRVDVIDEVDAEAKTRGLSRAKVLRDRVERAKWPTAA